MAVDRLIESRGLVSPPAAMARGALPCGSLPALARRRVMSDLRRPTSRRWVAISPPRPVPPR